MNLQSIIDELADQADDLLADAQNRKEAQTAISDALTARYSRLNGIDRQKILSTVMEILENEGFFDAPKWGSSWSEDSSEANTE